MKEEVDPGVRQTGAKAISELRRLERRTSLDLQVSEAATHAGQALVAGSGSPDSSPALVSLAGEEPQEQVEKDRKRHGAPGSRGGRRKRSWWSRSAAKHAAPAVVSLCVWLLWDGCLGLVGRRDDGGAVASAARALLGALLLLALGQALSGGSKRGAAVEPAFLRGTGSAQAAKAASALRRRLRTVVLHVFGEESADRAVKKAAEAEDMLRWVCGVVGVPTTPRGASHFELLEKIDEVERAVGIQ